MTTTNVTVQSSGAEGYSNLKTWLRDASPMLPGVHRSVFKRQLILACREFFEQSFAWQADMGPIPVLAGQNTYQLSPFTAYADIVGVLSVQANGVPLSPLYKRPAPLPNINSPGPPTSSLPAGYFMLRPDIIGLYPTPQTPLTTAVTLQLRVALKPKPTVEQVPMIAQTHFYDAILTGVLYRLMSQPAKPYTNLELAVYNEKRFRSYIGEYAARAKTGFNGAPNWVFPGFGK